MSASLSAPAVQRCIEATLACHGACEETITQFVRTSTPADEQDLIQTLMDCAEVTRMCADMLRRRSGLSGDIAALCARVCDTTADACSEVADPDPLERCVTLCREAAEVCRDLATARA
jgi:hypothetical protein